ncbi:MAG TPA: SPOR domain-containing protein [Acetobacteraceae bacterium]|nr:SPOR domain-containing protein [Acetobacteraceae bacterium]
MRGIILLCLCLALSGCIGSRPQETPISGGPPTVAAANGTTLRRMMGQRALDQPLLPRPGNIWADVLPAAEPGPLAAMPVSVRDERRPVVAEASGTVLRRHAAPAMVKSARPAAFPAAARATAITARPAVHRLAVQLAAARSAQRAEAEWRRLRLDAPKLTYGHQPAVSEADVNGRRVWRLRTAGFSDVAQASAFCSSMRAVKAACWVVAQQDR